MDWAAALKDRGLIIVDANAIMRRAFYAMDSLSYKGRTTHAVKGLLNKIQQLRSVARPSFMVIAFDGKPPYYRHTLYPQYKANRRAQKERDADKEKEFAVQTRLARKLLTLLGYHVAYRDGVEADDWCGTYTKAHDGHVVIVSGDKDFCQRVSSKVRIWDGKSNEFMDSKYVRARYGIEPKQFAAYLALVGDSVDNIPGIGGIGPVTAATLIREHGKLSVLWKRRKHIKGLGAKQLNSVTLDHLKLMHKLVQLYDVDEVDIDLCKVPPPRHKLASKQADAVREFNRKYLGFWSTENQRASSRSKSSSSKTTSTTAHTATAHLKNRSKK